MIAAKEVGGVFSSTRRLGTSPPKIEKTDGSLPESPRKYAQEKSGGQFFAVVNPGLVAPTNLPMERFKAILKELGAFMAQDR